MAVLFKCRKSYEVLAVVKMLYPDLRPLIRRHRIHFSLRERNKTVRQFKHTMACTKVLDVRTSDDKKPLLTTDVYFKRKITLPEIEDMINTCIPYENTGIISLVLLKCCGNFLPLLKKECKLALAQKIVDACRNKGNKLTRDHYEALLQCYVDNGHSIKFSEFLTELESAGVHPDAGLYSLMLKCLCEKGEMNDAIKVIEKMGSNGISLEESHYSNLIYGWVLLKDLQKANEIIRLMKNSDVPVGNSVYTALLRALSTYCETSLLSNYLSISKDKQVKFTDKQILEIVESLEIYKHYDLVPEVFNEQKTLTDEDITNLSFRLISNNCTDGAINLLKIAWDKNIIFICRKHKNIFKKLMFHNVPISDIISLSTLLVKEEVDEFALHHVLFHLYQNGTMYDCKKVLETMRKVGTQIRHHFLWPILSTAYRQNGGKGFYEVLSWIKEFKMSFDSETLVHMILSKINFTDYNLYKVVEFTGWPLTEMKVYILLFLLRTGEIPKASLFVKKYPSALLQRRKSVWLSFLAKGIVKCQSMKGFEDILRSLNPPVVDNLLYESSIDLYKFTYLLEILSAYQWKISVNCYENLNNVLPETLLTPYNKNLLKDMVGESIGDVDKHHNVVACLRNSRTREGLQMAIENKSVDLVPALEQILPLYIYNNYPKEALLTKCKLTEEGADLSSFKLRTATFSVYVMNKDLANSKKLFFDLQSTYPEKSVPLALVLDFCALLTEKGLHKESLKILSGLKLKAGMLTGYFCKLRTLLMAVATHNSVEVIEDYLPVLDLLVSWTPTLLTPFIKVFVERENLRDAVDIYEKICLRYKKTPYVVSLMALAIKKEDEDALRRIKAATRPVLGRKITYQEEFLALSKTGDVNKMRQILKKLRLFSNETLKYKCHRMLLDGKIDELLSVFYAVDNVENRNYLLNTIAACYDRLADYEGARKFLESLDENNVQVPNFFREKIEKFLS